jgi:hypothetical protein
MKTDLLKEAIADADAIKTLAIENAKASLNQAFDSKIKSMLAARLQEEAEEGEELEEEVEETDEAKKHSSEEEESEKESEKEAEAEDVDEIDINKILAEMGDDEEEMEDGEMEEAKGEEEEEKEEEESEEDEEEMDEVKDKEEEEEGEKESYDEEVDLDALLKELEMEEGSYEEGKEKMEDEEDAMKEAKKEDDEEDPHAMMKKMKEEHAAEIAEIKNQAAKLAGKVNETNLINAKLLYLNKILHKHNLNEAQKVKVIAAFDKATTVKEAKIVFESLNEAFVVKTDKSKTNLKESLGFASKAAGNSTKRDIISEADVQVARWQKLAGINKTI